MLGGSGGRCMLRLRARTQQREQQQRTKVFQ
jgi:hypothetical protein